MSHPGSRKGAPRQLAPASVQSPAPSRVARFRAPNPSLLPPTGDRFEGLPEVAPRELSFSHKPVRRKPRFPRSRLHVRSLRRSPQRLRSLRLTLGSRPDVLGLDRASSEADRETTRSLRTLRGANTRSPVWSSEARRRGLDYPRASLNRDAPVEPLETDPALFREPEFSRANRVPKGTRSE